MPSLEAMRKSSVAALPHLESADVGNSLQSEQVFRRFIESTTDYAIFMLTPQGRVASWNPGAERLKLKEPGEKVAHAT